MNKIFSMNVFPRKGKFRVFYEMKSIFNAFWPLTISEGYTWMKLVRLAFW